MTRREVETLLGFVFLAVLAAGFVVLSFEGKFNPLVEKTVLFVQFDDAQFLGRGANVRSEGLNIGRVDDIELNATGVLATLIVDEDVRVHSGYGVHIRSLSILGGRYVEVVRGDERKATLSSSRDRPLRGTADPDLFASVGEIFERAEPMIESAVANINDTMAKLGDAQGTLGKLFAEEDNPLRDNFSSVLQRFERTTALLNRMSAKVDDGAGTIGRLVNDPRLNDALSGTGERLGSIGDKLAAGGGPLGALLTDEELTDTLAGVRDRLAAHVERILQHTGSFAEEEGAGAEMRRRLSSALRNIEALMEKLESGKGPLFVLFSDPEAKAALERARDDLEAFADRPRTSTLDRFASDRKTLNDFERVYLDFREAPVDATDFSPVGSTVEGFLRGYIKNPPKRESRLSVGFGSSSSTSGSD